MNLVRASSSHVISILFQNNSHPAHFCSVTIWLVLRTVILILLVVCAGGTFCMENPQNSLVAFQSRFAWLVQLLEKLHIPVPCFNLIWAMLDQFVFYMA